MEVCPYFLHSSRLCLDPVSAQMGNDRVEAMAETKLLDFNLDKSVIIIIGKANVRSKMEDDFTANPPLLYGEKMKQVAQEKYLGDQISNGGLGASILATISKRRGKVLQTIFEIKAVIDDCRSHVIGGIVTGLEIWEMAVVPYLLNNADTWTGLTDIALEDLDDLQNLFYRVLLQVPAGCPKPIMYWDCGGLTMNNRIMKKKLMFLHHIATLSPDSLAHQVYCVQKKLMLPGLVEECQDVLNKFQIPEITQFSKGQWKHLINQKFAIKNRDELLEKMKRLKKIDSKEMSVEKFELKDYFKSLHLSESRDKFRLRSFMTTTVQTNFSNYKQFSADIWSC